MSHRSTIAAARGSVPRASAFSWSVMVITRSVRISSISVASNRSPALSGAMLGWSPSTMGDTSTASVPESSATITGQQRCCVQDAASAAAWPGGSSSDTNLAACAVTSRWVPTKE